MVSVIWVHLVPVFEDELSSMSGIANLHNKQHGVCVNVVKTNVTDNLFGALHSKLDAVSKTNCNIRKFEHGYSFKRLSAGIDRKECSWT